MPDEDLKIGPSTEFVTFSMTKIPRPIWDRAKAKAATYRPPLSMRWLLISLLERFAPEEATAAPAVVPEPKPPKPAPKPRLSGAKRRKAAKGAPVDYAPPVPADVTVNTAGMGKAPDLGNSF